MSHRWLAGLAGLLFAATAFAAEADVVVKDVSRPGRPGRTLEAATVIAAPLPKLCAILQDYPRYPGFMPNTAAATVVQRGEGFSVVDMTLKLPLGKIKRYRLRMVAEAAPARCQVGWTMLPRADLKPEETIADTSGRWLLQADGSGGTRVDYRVFTDPGPVPTGFGWIVDSLSKDSVPKALDALRERANKP